MPATEDTPTTYSEAVETLARWHAGTEPVDLEIYSFPDARNGDVRLIEVSEDFPFTGKVLVVTFGASKEFPFRSSVAMLTPEEWRRVLQGSLALPEGWELGRRQRVWPNGGA